MDTEKISKFILKLRKDNNLTQEKLANMLHVTYQAVSKWETGKSIPDIATLNLISKTFNIDLNELINGEKKTKRNKFFIIIIIVLSIAIILFGIYSVKRKHEIAFKTISSTCEQFKITGIAAYNKETASIYISDITYCNQDPTLYKSINCILYSSNGNTNVKIAEVNSESESYLSDYLNNVKISVDNFSKSCPTLANSQLYLEINAKDNNEKITTYRINLELKDNCN
jgi:transcriptional regulator with XRE-family HTH domain